MSYVTMTGKERYEVRRQQEHDNEMARLRMQQAHYDNSTEEEETATLVTRALKAFLNGEAHLSIEPSNIGNIVRFYMPPALPSHEADK